jgi:hypothetical protein
LHTSTGGCTRAPDHCPKIFFQDNLGPCHARRRRRTRTPKRSNRFETRARHACCRVTLLARSLADSAGKRQAHQCTARNGNALTGDGSIDRWLSPLSTESRDLLLRGDFIYSPRLPLRWGNELAVYGRTRSYVPLLSVCLMSELAASTREFRSNEWPYPFCLP